MKVFYFYLGEREWKIEAVDREEAILNLTEEIQRNNEKEEIIFYEELKIVEAI
jgi:hypothetical protein